MCLLVSPVIQVRPLTTHPTSHRHQHNRQQCILVINLSRDLSVMSNSRRYKVMKVITISCNLLLFIISIGILFAEVYDQICLLLESSRTQYAIKSIVNKTIINENDKFLQQLPHYILIMLPLVTASISGIGLLGFIRENVIIILIYTIIITASWILRFASMIKFNHYSHWTDIFYDLTFLLIEALLVVLSFCIAYELKRVETINQPDSLSTFIDTRTSVKTVPVPLSTAGVKEKETDIDELETSTCFMANERTTSSTTVTYSAAPLLSKQQQQEQDQQRQKQQQQQQPLQQQQGRRSLTKASLNVRTNFG